MRRKTGSPEKGIWHRREARGQPQERQGHPGTRDALQTEGPGLACRRPWERHTAESRRGHGALVGGTGSRKLGDSQCHLWTGLHCCSKDPPESAVTTPGTVEDVGRAG